MFPSVASSELMTNAESVSKCSVLQIDHTVGNAGGCLERPDPCKNGGACCSGANLKTKGTACGEQDATNMCLDAPVCDGTHAECPRGPEKKTGTVCFMGENSSVWGECITGACRAMHAEACSGQAAQITGPCVVEGYECVRTCNDKVNGLCIAAGAPDSGPACKALGNAVGRWINGETCEIVAAGSKCISRGSPGTCQVCEHTRTSTHPHTCHPQHTPTLADLVFVLWRRVFYATPARLLVAPLALVWLAGGRGVPTGRPMRTGWHVLPKRHHRTQRRQLQRRVQPRSGLRRRGHHVPGPRRHTVRDAGRRQAVQRKGLLHGLFRLPSGREGRVYLGRCRREAVVRGAAEPEQCVQVRQGSCCPHGQVPQVVQRLHRRLGWARLS